MTASLILFYEENYTSQKKLGPVCLCFWLTQPGLPSKRWDFSSHWWSLVVRMSSLNLIKLFFLFFICSKVDFEWFPLHCILKSPIFSRPQILYITIDKATKLHFNQKWRRMQFCRSLYCALVSSGDKVGQKVENIHFYLEVFLPFITVSLMLVSATTSDFLRYNK